MLSLMQTIVHFIFSIVIRIIIVIGITICHVSFIFAIIIRIIILPYKEWG